MRTQVAIIGAGPAGLLLGRLLEQAGVENVILEARDRAYIEARQRAGILEQGTMDTLSAAGAGERMERERLPHDGLELLFDGAGHRIDLHALTGRRVAIYAQTEIVKDLVAARLESGSPLLFDVEVTAVDTGATPAVAYTHEGASHRLEAELIAGCDGFHGICRDIVTFGSVVEREYPFSWLGILADAAPSSHELIYANHADGFALASMRSDHVSRLYLQVPNGEDLGAWSDDRIWTELARRFHRHDGFTLNTGPITDRSVTPMRSYVAAPMRHGNLFLAGDAAHIVPPTGAKGLNLAAADVTILADAIAGGDLDSYSDRALRRVWRCEHFSWWMTSMLHRFDDHDAFDRALQRSQLEYVVSSEAAMTSLAENYAGLPL
jgi:p-hydroxybenzoate 3-monooxygenase